MLLKVDFAGCPEVDAGMLYQRLEFFLWAFCTSGFA
jgi:hypothetical protein